MKYYSVTHSNSSQHKISWIKTAGFSILIILAIYLAIVIYPNCLFAYSIHYKNFNVYSNHPLDINIYKVLEVSEKNLSTSELYYNNLSQNIYLCNSKNLYTFLAPFARKAFAVNYPLTNYVFIALSDIRKNEAFRKEGKTMIVRPLSQLITHETTHTLIKKKLGFWKNMKLSTWKKEGYCDYIAYNDKNMLKNERELLLKIEKDRSGVAMYKRFYYAVTYLEQQLHMSFDDIVKTPLTLKEVLYKIKQLKKN